MTCSTTSAPWSNASTPGSRTNSAPGSCACAAPSRSNAISCSASSPSPSIKYSACPRCKKLRVDQLAAQVSEKSRASQIMQEAQSTKIKNLCVAELNDNRKGTRSNQAGAFLPHNREQPPHRLSPHGCYLSLSA